MTHVLSGEGREILRGLARDGAVLALDFDGTLAPIVEDPRAARMRPRTAALLRAAAKLFPCAVVSGRARADVLGRLGDAPVRVVVGNHGAEWGGAGPASVPRPAADWARALRAGLDDEDGVEVEEKGITVAVHYRRARSPDVAQRKILQLAALLPGARVFGGHAVVNVVPVGAPTKADALQAISLEFPPAPLLYVGDDETDEDAFRSHVVTCGVRVGRSATTAARFHLEDQAEIDALLWAFVSERAHASGLDGWEALDPARGGGGEPPGGEAA